MKYQDEVRAFITKAERSLKAGKLLLSEEDYDFAISRLYYSMFYCAEALLLTKDMKFSKHSAVISRFGREFIKTGMLPQKLHHYLIRSFKEREKGDYEVIIFPTKDEAEEILANAETFISETKDYLNKREYNV